MRKFKICGLIALVMTVVVVVAINVNVALQERGLSDLSLATLETLAQGEDPGGENYKICFFKGSTTFTDYYSCEEDYPQVGPCGNTDRVNKWFSADKSSCTL